MKKIKLLSLMLAVIMLLTLCKVATAEEKAKVDSDIDLGNVGKSKIIVSMEWVNEALQGKVEGYNNLVVVEGSWGKTEDNAEYLKTHLPNAIHIDTDDLEHDSEPGVSDKDNYNIKSAEDVEKVLLQNGITKDSKVVVYGSTVGASRVAFILLWAGVEDVKLMSGNIKSWEKKATL